MEKKLFELLKQKLEEKIQVFLSSQKDAQDEANYHKGAMESRYDTFKEEAQDKVARLEIIIRQLKEEKQILMHMEHQKISNNFFSFITLTSGSSEICLFLSPILSGEKIHTNGKIFFVITKNSPMGSILIDKKVGDKFVFNQKSYTILKIEKKLN